MLDAGVPLDELEERRASGGKVGEPPPVPGGFAKELKQSSHHVQVVHLTLL